MAGFAARRFRVIGMAACGLAMVAGVLVAVFQPVSGGQHGSPYGTSVGTGTQQARKPGWAQTDGPGVTALPDHVMPRGGSARVAVGAGVVNVGGVGVRLAGAGVRLVSAGPAGAVLVRVLGQGAARALGLRGVVVTLLPGGAAAGQAVTASFDYSSFTNAYGADFGRRLRLVSLPGCALTTSGVPACQAQVPLPGGVNAGSSVSATVRLPAAGGGGQGWCRGAAGGGFGVEFVVGRGDVHGDELVAGV